ncbi:hypothetical protein Q9L58_005940 [Maublancomyces gigas]|uniref:Exosome complex protein n=1 Tax=Discina gigas TaxID=1032678 RepID=A0ABR3GGQ0_9PEZI
MNASQVMDLVNLLDDQVDDIEDALAPLLKSSLQDIAAKLPVVDKARLYVLTTYAIDSLLFSYLRLNGVNAREHPVMRELERIKQYVKKINEAQGAVTEVKREVTLNKAVAARFIKHDLAGNDQWDRERAAEKIREKAAAHSKFEELSRKIEKRKAAEEVEEEEEAGAGAGAEEKQDSGSESDEENLKDKYKDDEILEIIDTEDTKDEETPAIIDKDTLEEKRAKNEEQVNRILNTFKSHGVASTVKRKLPEDGPEEYNKRKKLVKKAKKELRAAENASKSSHKGEGVYKKGKKGHRKPAK